MADMAVSEGRLGVGSGRDQGVTADEAPVESAWRPLPHIADWRAAQVDRQPTLR